MSPVGGEVTSNCVLRTPMTAESVFTDSACVPASRDAFREMLPPMIPRVVCCLPSITVISTEN